MKKIDVMFTRTNDGDYLADFDCVPDELPKSNVFFFMAVNEVDLLKAEAAAREAAALREQLAQAQATIGTLRAELVFEKSKQIGARYVIDETPFGQALDGLGDEVE